MTGAKEMALARKEAEMPTVWMSTFHRFCARLLRMYGQLVGLGENYSIYDMDDSRRMLAEAILDEGVDRRQQHRHHLRRSSTIVLSASPLSERKPTTQFIGFLWAACQGSSS